MNNEEIIIFTNEEINKIIEANNICDKKNIKYKIIKEKEEENKENDNEMSIIAIKLISYIIILAILIATCALTNNCYEILQEITQTTQQ